MRADARAEEYRARMMRAADEHAKALALAVEDEEICACRLAVTWTEHVPVLAETHMVNGVIQSRTVMVGTAFLEANLRDAQHEVDRLRATVPKVPPPRPGAERFEAPLVRDKATAHAMERNKYEFAPAGTRAAHKRTPPPADAVARGERCAKREEVQRWRRATARFVNIKGARVAPRAPWGVSLHYVDHKPRTISGVIGRAIVEAAIGVDGWLAAWRAQAKPMSYSAYKATGRTSIKDDVRSNVPRPGR